MAWIPVADSLASASVDDGRDEQGRYVRTLGVSVLHCPHPDIEAGIARRLIDHPTTPVPAAEVVGNSDLVSLGEAAYTLVEVETTDEAPDESDIGEPRERSEILVTVAAASQAAALERARQIQTVLTFRSGGLRDE